MMEYEDTETSSEISSSWKFELNSHYLLHSEHQVDRHQAISELSLCSQGYHYLLLAELGLLGQSCVCELNTSCNLNLLWDTYYRLLLLSSLFSSFPLPSLHFFFFFFSEMRQRGRRPPFLPPVNYSPVRLSVRLNWRLRDASVIPVGSARTMEAHIADRPSAQPKLNWKSSISSLA